MRRLTVAAAIAGVVTTAGMASAQSSNFTFEGGTDEGFGTPFGDDATATFPVVNVGGSNRLQIGNTAGFQEAGRQVSNPADPFYQAMLAASGNEAGYVLSYDYYIDTSATPGANGSFLQLGTFVNTGGGYYAQNYGPQELHLDGTQLSSGQVFSGTVSQTFAAKGYDIPAGETFFRIGFIINGGGTNAPIVYFDNIQVAPVPEPASAVAIVAGATGMLRRRRRA